jgi:hypothetical protein
MVCPRLEHCGFFREHRNSAGRNRYELLLRSYCQGPFQPLCKRLKYMLEREEEPPAQLRPDGYQAGTNIRIL